MINVPTFVYKELEDKDFKAGVNVKINIWLKCLL